MTKRGRRVVSTIELINRGMSRDELLTALRERDAELIDQDILITKLKRKLHIYKEQLNHANAKLRLNKLEIKSLRDLTDTLTVTAAVRAEVIRQHPLSAILEQEEYFRNLPEGTVSSAGTP